MCVHTHVYVCQNVFLEVRGQFAEANLSGLVTSASTCWTVLWTFSWDLSDGFFFSWSHWINWFGEKDEGRPLGIFIVTHEAVHAACLTQSFGQWPWLLSWGGVYLISPPSRPYLHPAPSYCSWKEVATKSLFFSSILFEVFLHGRFSNSLLFFVCTTICLDPWRFMLFSWCFWLQSRTCHLDGCPEGFSCSDWDSLCLFGFQVSYFEKYWKRWLLGPLSGHNIFALSHWVPL